MEDARKNIGHRNSSYFTKPLPGKDHPKRTRNPSSPNAPTTIILVLPILSDIWPNTMAPSANRPPRTPRKIKVSLVRAILESLKAFGRRKYIPKIMVWAIQTGITGRILLPILLCLILGCLSSHTLTGSTRNLAAIIPAMRKTPAVTQKA